MSNDAFYFVALANQHHQAGNLSQAEALFRQALDIDPRDADVLNKLGLVLAAQLKTDDAIDSYWKALRLQSVNPEARANLAAAYLMQREWESAKEQLRHMEEAAASQLCLDYLDALVVTARRSDYDTVLDMARDLFPNNA